MQPTGLNLNYYYYYYYYTHTHTHTHTQIQDPTMKGTSITPTSQVHATSMMVLFITGQKLKYCFTEPSQQFVSTKLATFPSFSEDI
jgi:hypothetical protein